MEETSSQTQQLIDKLIKPAVAGVYFSKHDIVKIALGINGAITVGDRKMMFKDLFKLVDSAESFQELLDVIIAHTEDKIGLYRQMIDEYPHCAFAMTPWIEQSQTLITHLKEIKEEVYL